MGSNGQRTGIVDRGSWTEPELGTATTDRDPARSRARARERPRPRRLRLKRAGELLDLVGLDDVAHLDVVHAVERHAAFEALLHLAHVVLEALERAQAALPDRHAFAQQADLRGARNVARRHHAAGDR